MPAKTRGGVVTIVCLVAVFAVVSDCPTRRAVAEPSNRRRAQNGGGDTESRRAGTENR